MTHPGKKYLLKNHCNSLIIKDNDHTAWAIVEAEAANDARQMVPWFLRNKARIVRLVKFNLANDKLDP
jgi:hypothetical protein